MSNLRFGLMVAVAFALTFVGVMLGMKNTPVMAMRGAPPTPDAPVPTIADGVKPDAAKDATDAKPTQVVTVAPSKLRQALQRIDNPPPADRDPGRNRMRLTAIQAADAYALSPCDQAIKAAFVVATATYVKAMSGDKADAGAKPFSTSTDARLREAIQKAFETGGVTKDDFPTGTQLWIATLAPTQRADISPCAIGKTAERLQR